MLTLTTVPFCFVFLFFVVMYFTGFDAHDDDPLADCELTDEDFEWVTDVILQSCAKVAAAAASPSPGAPPAVRYLSVLEGGYDLPAIQRSAVCHVRAMLRGLPPVPPPTTPTTGTDADADAVKDKAEKQVDGEILAIQEYLESFGIDAKP
jgi:acetoin utilization deacetylase AcuC-like enzyme